MSAKEKTMKEVKAIVFVPKMAVSYDHAHSFMANFVKEHKGEIQAEDAICISFRHASDVSHSFYYGLAEYINAHYKLEWSVQHSSGDFPVRLRELAPNIDILPKTVIPFVRRKVEEF